LVSTPSDFGVMGQTPSHPELLDYLADWFVSHGWRLKPLHRLIVLSSAYQTASEASGGRQPPVGDKQDGEQHGAGAPRSPEDPRLALFGRWRQHRLEAEAVRDGILAVSGQLNPQRGGPGVYPSLPAEVLAGQSRPGDGWGKSSPRE